MGKRDRLERTTNKADAHHFLLVVGMGTGSLEGT